MLFVFNLFVYDQRASIFGATDTPVCTKDDSLRPWYFWFICSATPTLDFLPGPQIGTENGSKLNINQLNGDQLKTVKDNAVKIEISVSDEQEGSVTMPTTVANTDVTKPLIINTKFAASPGPSSESTDTASEVTSHSHLTFGVCCCLCHILCEFHNYVYYTNILAGFSNVKAQCD